VLSLQDWLERLESRGRGHIDLGLYRCVAVAQSLGLCGASGGVELPFAVAVVGGTNGKGSTCALMAAMAIESGYRVSVYSSPHLLQFEERLTLNGGLSEASDWARAMSLVEAAETASGHALTYFEFVTLAAIQMVKEAAPDLAIFEVGLGGRLDAVNILQSDVAVLTSIDLDHQAYLGDTREKIGWEKAHIARPGRPLVVGDPMPPQTVLQVAQEVGADVWLFGRDFNYQGDRQQWSWSGRSSRRNALAYPALRGVNQLLNASAALAALAALHQRLPITQGGVRQGLALASLPGRFQVLAGRPSVVLDVAHNPHAAGALASNLDQMGFFPQTVAVVGLLADKDATAVFERLISRVDAWCLAGLSGPEVGARARSAQELADVLQALVAAQPSGGRPGLGPAPVFLFPSPKEALEKAASLVEASDRIVVFGSFHTVAAVWDDAHRIGLAPHAPDAH